MSDDAGESGKPPAKSPLAGLGPPGANLKPPAVTPELPREHYVEPPSVAYVPRWKKILFQLFRGASVVAGPAAGAAAATPAIVQVQPAKPAPAVDMANLLQPGGEWTRYAVESQLSDAAAQAASDSVLAAYSGEKTEAEQSEFRLLVHEALSMLREKSAEMAKDIAKDLTKEAIELYLLAKVAKKVVEKLRSKPGNRIASRTADILDELIAHKAEHPRATVTPLLTATAAHCSDAEARAALQLIGCVAAGDRWIPFGLDIGSSRYYGGPVFPQTTLGDFYSGALKPNEWLKPRPEAKPAAPPPPTLDPGPPPPKDDPSKGS